jgi:enamine deaminase RidA (YjgF/YER057c/UK114 family)
MRHVLRSNGMYACGVADCDAAFASEPGLKRHCTVIHKLSKKSFVVVAEGSRPRQRRAASAAAGDASPGADGEGGGAAADPPAGEEDFVSDDDGDFVMRPTGDSAPVERRARDDDQDVTRDSSSSDDDGGDAATGGGGGRGRFGAANIGASRFLARDGDFVGDDADDDANSEDLNREATHLAGASGDFQKKRKRNDPEPGWIGAGENGAPGPYKKTCPVCARVFVGPQGVPGHYKKHATQGVTEDERLAGRNALAAHVAEMDLKKANGTYGFSYRKGVKPPKKKRGGFGRRLKPVAALGFHRGPSPSENGVSDDADVSEEPFLLASSARNCSECRLRCRTLNELIEHMLEKHGIEARNKEEVEGPMGDLAGLQPFVGEAVDVDASDASPRYAAAADANANALPRASQHRNAHSPSLGGVGADGDPERAVDIELVRDVLIRQQTSERHLEDAETQLKNQAFLIGELRSQMDQMAHAFHEQREQNALLIAQRNTRHPFDPRAEIRRVTVSSEDLGYAPITVFGRMVYLTGVVASDLFPDAARQTRESLHHLKHILHKAGTDLKHLLKVTVYLSDIRQAEKMHGAWDAFFDFLEIPVEYRPTRITQSAYLKSPEYLVELHAEAVLPPPAEAEAADAAPTPAAEQTPS